MKRFIPGIVCAVLFILIHLIALYFHFYWTVWWFDIGMHVFGGFIAAYLLVNLFCKDVSSRRHIFWIALCGSLLIGVIWEVYEYATGMTFAASDTYVLDTFSDLLSDICGGLLAFLIL